MKAILNVHLIGRLGNQMFTYAWARATCEREGMELRTNPWLGQKIFEINDPPASAPMLEDYCQRQECLIYSRADCRRWFKWKPDIIKALSGVKRGGILMHLRRGDYAHLGYVRVSRASYLLAAEKRGIPEPQEVSEENPAVVPGFDGELSCVPDFVRMMDADCLFRANSTFSWWAAALGNAPVYSPVIEGKTGGMEHDCDFVAGNWPRFVELPFVTDLHLKD